MSEQETQFEQKLKRISGRAILTMFACVIAANAFQDLGWLPYIVGFTLASAIALIIEYWIPPKPPVSFPVWLAKIFAFFILIMLGLWIVPRFLSRWIWSPLAYGLPTFILFMSIYWMPPLYPIKRKDALWKWILLSLGFGLVFALLGYFNPYK